MTKPISWFVMWCNINLFIHRTLSTCEHPIKLVTNANSSKIDKMPSSYLLGTLWTLPYRKRRSAGRAGFESGHRPHHRHYWTTSRDCWLIVCGQYLACASRPCRNCVLISIIFEKCFPRKINVDKKLFSRAVNEPWNEIFVVLIDLWLLHGMARQSNQIKREKYSKRKRALGEERGEGNKCCDFASRRTANVQLIMSKPQSLNRDTLVQRTPYDVVNGL